MFAIFGTIVATVVTGYGLFIFAKIGFVPLEYQSPIEWCVSVYAKRCSIQRTTPKQFEIRIFQKFPYIDADIVVELGVDVNIVMFVGKSNPVCCHHKNN